MNIGLDDNSEEGGKNILAMDVLYAEKEDENEGLYEKIMEKETFSKNRIRIMICMIFVFIADGMEMTIFNLIIKPFGNYFKLEESDIEIQITTSSLFFGVAIGSGIASLLTSKFGRVLSIKVSNVIFFISHLLMGIWLSLPIFIICRSIVGLTLGIIIPIFMNIYGEYLPIKYRGFLLMVAWSFYGVGQLITNLVGLFVMPNLESSRLRLYLLILTILPFLSLIGCIFLLTDSPKGLLLSKNILDNRNSINALNEINKEDLNEEQQKKLKEEVDNAKKISDSFSFKDIIREMFGPELKKTTILMLFIFIYLGYNAFGIYSISSYFLDYLDEKENGKKNNDPDNTTDKTPAKEIIVNQIMYAVAEIVANILGGFFGEIKKLGRKGGISIFTFLAAIFTVLGLFKKILFEITSPISSGCTTIYVNLAMDYVVELYPTKIRDTSTSLLYMIYRVSSFLCNFISMGCYNINKYIPYIIYVICAILLCLFTFSLPYEMAGKSMK